MKAVHLVRYPVGAPVAGDFAVIDEVEPAIADGEVRVRVRALGMDPAVRMRMAVVSRMGPPMALGVAVGGRGVGRVLESRAAGFAMGDLVGGELGWREQAVVAGAALERLETAGQADGAAEHAHLNALGPTGLAAWFAVEALAPRVAETCVIAPAAGAVGSLAAQLALRAGARVIGMGRGAGQLEYLRAMGVEAAEADGDLAALGGGVDCFLDGVGGALHGRVLRTLNPRARVLLIGFVAAYNDAGPPAYGDAAAILFKRATMSGFLLADHMARAPDARAKLAALIADGALRPAEALWHGLAKAPQAFAALFADAPPGKQIVILED